MQVSHPNENGVLSKGYQEFVAQKNRSYAAICIALCSDGLYRMSVELSYSQGGFSGPICCDDNGYASLDAARTAGLHELLKRWRNPLLSDPQNVHDELCAMREQVEARLQQPSLFCTP